MEYLNQYCFITVASTFSTPQELAVALARDADAGALIFGIDGTNGAGKSRLAKDIKACLGWPIVSVDCFLNKDQGEYVSHLDLERLRRAISRSRCPLIIAGVCLLDVLQRLSLKQYRLIYVQRLSPCGHWYDEEFCDFDCSADEVIAKQEERIRDTLSPFEIEVIRYHGRYKPARHADYLYTHK